MNTLRLIGISAGLAFFANSAMATPVPPFVRELDLPAGDHASIPAIRLILNTDNIDELTVQSSVIGASTDRVVLPNRAAGTVVSAAILGTDRGLLQTTPFVDVLVQDSEIEFESPHFSSLAPGQYAERIVVDPSVRGTWVQQTWYRFFQVTLAGIRASTAEDYTRAALILEVLADGTSATRGVLAPRTLEGGSRHATTEVRVGRTAASSGSGALQRKDGPHTFTR
jgi:hypothetical protein